MVNINQSYCSKEFSINKESGMYRFIPDGGTGKTYVYNILNKLILPGTLIATYDSNTDMKVDKIMSINSDSVSYKLIYLDRADMYMTKELYEKLSRLSKHTTVILDLKNKQDYMKKTLWVATACISSTGVYVF